MNRNQTIALWVGVAVMTLMFVFPPWTETPFFAPSPAGYSPLWNPADHAFSIDYLRLVIQWVVVGIVTKAAMRTLEDKEGEDDSEES